MRGGREMQREGLMEDLPARSNLAKRGRERSWGEL